MHNRRVSVFATSALLAGGATLLVLCQRALHADCQCAQALSQQCDPVLLNPEYFGGTYSYVLCEGRSNEECETLGTYIDIQDIFGAGEAYPPPYTTAKYVGQAACWIQWTCEFNPNTGICDSTNSVDGTNSSAQYQTVDCPGCYNIA